jgi:hypothetical protein
MPVLAIKSLPVRKDFDASTPTTRMVRPPARVLILQIAPPAEGTAGYEYVGRHLREDR